MFSWLHPIFHNINHREYMQRVLVDALYNSTAEQHEQFYTTWRHEQFYEQFDTTWQNGVFEIIVQNSLAGNFFEQARSVRASVTFLLSVNAEDLNTAVMIMEMLQHMAQAGICHPVTAPARCLRSRKIYAWMMTASLTERRTQQVRRFEHWRAIVRIMLSQVAPDVVVEAVLQDMRIEDHIPDFK